MTQINPFTGAIIMGGQLPPRQVADKDRQIRRTHNLAKNSALQGDQLEHQVESSDALGRPNDNPTPEHHRRPPQPPEKDEDEPHIDLTA